MKVKRKKCNYVNWIEGVSDRTRVWGGYCASVYVCECMAVQQVGAWEVGAAGSSFHKTKKKEREREREQKTEKRTEKPREGVENRGRELSGEIWYQIWKTKILVWCKSNPLILKLSFEFVFRFNCYFVLLWNGMFKKRDFVNELAYGLMGL